MTTFDQMAYNDPVGAAACADAGRFGDRTPIPRPDPDFIERGGVLYHRGCSNLDCDGTGRVVVSDEDGRRVEPCPVCQPDEPAPTVEPTFLPYPWSAP